MEREYNPQTSEIKDRVVVSDSKTPYYQSVKLNPTFSTKYEALETNVFSATDPILSKVEEIGRKKSAKFKKYSKSNQTTKNENIQAFEKILNAVNEDQFSEKQIQSIYKFNHSKRFNFNSLLTLPREIIKKNIFSGYNFCQIMLHEKGKPITESFVFGEDEKIKFFQLPTEEFNSIYNVIKKSKLKLFNQSNLLNSYISLTGTFLAKALSFKNHSLILILSRSDFLLPEQSEQKEFDNIFEGLVPNLSNLISKHKINNKLNYLILSLENITIPFAIYDKNQNIIFSNSNFITEQTGKITKPELIEKTIQMTNGVSIKLLKPSNQSSVEELYHHQRISLLGELLNTLKHELSNPLFGINLSSNMFSEDNLNSEDFEFIEGISSSSERCQEIIQTFSDLYTNESSTSEFNIRKLVSEVLTLAKSATRGIPTQLEISPEIDENINTYHSWVSQILFNFIINASQAIKSKTDKLQDESIIIKISKRDNDGLAIEVIDSGPGIPTDIDRKIFNPFFTTKPGGTGLGLAICHNLANKMGGSIYFHNNTKGATFGLNIYPRENNENTIN